MANKVTQWVLELVDNLTAPLRTAQEAARGAKEAVNDVSGATERVNKSGYGLKETAANIAATMFAFNQVSEGVNRFNGELKNAIAPGEQFQYSMAELQAITGLAGKGLEEIGDKAKVSAEKFGGNAAQSVEVYKLLLSQLSPELANNSDALATMSDNVLTLSKQMKSPAEAAEVLTTAMNQYGVSMSDPVAAGAEMTRMMNIMAAAAREGSAELPQQKEALAQAGLAAKTANVAFSETAAAIQVLDKAGKKGSEGGVALRNVLTTLSQGRFLPKDVREELSAAGVNIDDLTDKNKTLYERLMPLRGIMEDSALLVKMFGKENQASAIAMLEGLDLMKDYQTAIEGTNTAFEQANTIMETNIEKKSRMAAWVDNVKIGFFDAIAPITPFVEMVGEAMSGVVSFSFAVYGLSVVLKKELWISLASSVKGIALFVAKSVSGAASSVFFAVTSGTAFSAFATAAKVSCQAVSVAISSIPIIGWIAAAIAAIAGLIAYFYSTSSEFRGFMWGLWEAVKVVFSGIWGFIKETMEGVWHLIKGVFNPANWFDDSFDISDGLDKITHAAKTYGEAIGKAFSEGRDAGMEDFESRKKQKKAENTSGYTGLTASAATSGNKSGIGSLKESVTKEKSLNLSGSGATGGGKSITMHVTMHNHFSGLKNADEMVEVVVRKINDKLNDSLAAI